MLSLRSLAAIALFPIASATLAQDATPGAMGTSSISGTVKFTGAPSKAEALNMSSDPACGASHSGGVSSDAVVVDPSGGLKWAFVYVKSGLAGTYAPPKTPVVLDQVGCLFKPHVFGVQVRQKIEIRNSDAILHNVHAMPTNNREFNLGMPMKNMKLKKKFKKPEVMVPIKCDVHAWMKCFAGVVDSPFYGVSGDDGSFSIAELPAGTYTLEAWHETFGTATQEVTVGDGEAKSIEFSFAG